MTVDASDEAFMRRALELAQKGRGRTAPNPIVGAVVVREGRVVGEGFHERAGEAHAEIHALREAGSSAKGATGPHAGVPRASTSPPKRIPARTATCAHKVRQAQ